MGPRRVRHRRAHTFIRWTASTFAATTVVVTEEDGSKCLQREVIREDMMHSRTVVFPGPVTFQTFFAPRDRELLRFPSVRRFWTSGTSRLRAFSFSSRPDSQALDRPATSRHTGWKEITAERRLCLEISIRRAHQRHRSRSRTVSHMVLLVSVATPVHAELNTLFGKHKRDTAHRSWV